MAVTRLSGGLTPADGADPRTFPAIWNATADDIEAGDYSKVPTGGAAGEVLVKQSGTNFASAWAAPMPRVAIGEYKNPSSTAEINSTNYLRDRVYAQPVDGGLPMTVDRIFLSVTGNLAGAEARLGIYDYTTFVPTDLIVESGVIDISTSGNKEVAVDVALPRFFCVAWIAWGSSTPQLNYFGNNYLMPQTLGTGNRNAYETTTNYSVGSNLPTSFGAYTLQSRGMRCGVRRSA